MNDYKSDEYRTAKYLRSQPIYVEYFKRHRAALLKIGKGVWGNIEYIDEIIENPQKTIYHVAPGDYYRCQDIGSMDYYFTPARVKNLRNMVVFSGDRYEGLTIPVALSAVNLIELSNGIGYLIAPYDIMLSDFEAWDIHCLPVIQQPYITYIELFFDKTEADEYAAALTEYLQYNANAVSAVSRYI